MRINSEAWTTLRDGSTALTVSLCKQCDQINFPPLERCPSCWSTEVEKKELSGYGTLYSFSVVHERKKGLPMPYIVGYVDFPEGVRAFGIIDVPFSRAIIDLQVKPGLLQLIDDNGIVLGEMYCFRPVEGDEI